ncbi:MAG: Rad52/Rad22 family DNA repair protein [Terriglobales bacterium]
MATHKINLEEIRAQLRAPLPPEAIKPDPRNSKLSAINPAFVIERLNDCFGEGGWREKYTVVEAHPDSRMIVVRCDFAVPSLKIFRQAFGGNANEDRGDAYKGACTDALTKATSKLGIAHQVYKGEYDVQIRQETKAERDPTYEKRMRLQRPISAFQIKQFLLAIQQTGKSGAEVNKHFQKLRITEISEMQRGEFNESIRWARKKNDLTAALTASVELAKPPAPASSRQPDEGPLQRTLPV